MEAQPADTEAREALARACARSGRAADAMAAYDALLARDADNVDWLLGKAQALMALGRAGDALPLLARARALAPGYEDLWRVQASALDALDEFAAADTLLTEAATRFPASAWPLERRQASRDRRLRERGTRISGDFSYESLSGERSPWKGASLGLDRRLGDARRVSAGLHLEERFDIRDEQLHAGYADRLANGWSYAIAGDLAPNARNLPHWSFAAEAGRELRAGLSVGARMRHAHHDAVDVDTLTTTVEKYAGPFSLAYSLTAAKVSGIGDAHFGHVIRAAREYGEGSRAALVLGFGEEAESVAPGIVQVTQTKSVALGGLHWLSAAWGFAWEAGWYKQGDLYDRVRVRLGVEHRF